MRKAFGRSEVEIVFRKIGRRLDRRITVFLLGGGAMAFRGQKVATKDLDLVFETQSKFVGFVRALKELGYDEKLQIEGAYEEMKAKGIFENREGFRFDLFVKSVCGCLSLSPGMVARSVVLGEYGMLRVRVVSNEDVVLFKGITERLDDVNDIAAIIARAEINWELVLEECAAQSGEQCWYGALLNKFNEIERVRGITVPIAKRLGKLDRKSILKEAYEKRIRGGMTREAAINELLKNGFKKKEIQEVIS